MRNPSSFLFLTLILFVSSNLFGQTREELEQKRFDIIQQIDDTNELLKLTAKNKNILLSDLTILESQIENRQLLLEQIQKEIEIIDRDIIEAEARQEKTLSTLDSLTSQYHVILRAVYRQRRMHNPMLSLLSTQSVSESFLKANFYNRLKGFIGDKLKVIQSQQIKLESEITALSRDKDSKREVLQQEAKQSNLLKNELDRQNVMIVSLQADEESLKKSLTTQKKDREQMNLLIEDIIHSELIATTATSSAFAALKGKMNWPVDGGVVSSKYGNQRHPTMKNLTITNNGIDIRAPLNADVKVVFPGKVVSVSQMSGFGTTIIVEHDQFYTVYSKLGNSLVKKGDLLSGNMIIGKLDVKDDSSELHFEVWKDNQTQNPLIWLN